MHRRANILQYVKNPSGRWQWAPIPKNKRTGAYLWSKTKSDRFYIAWREQGRRRYAKAGNTPSEALEAKRRKEFELMGRAVLVQGKQVPRAAGQDLTVDAAISHVMDFVRRKRRPNTYKRYRSVMHRPNGHILRILKNAVERAQLKGLQNGSIAQRIFSVGPPRYIEARGNGRLIPCECLGYEGPHIRGEWYILKSGIDPVSYSKKLCCNP